jgi:hypothetical protein
MSTLKILKAIIPTKRIMAWVLGLITAGLAVLGGLNAPELKDQFCKDVLPEIPKLEADK